MKTIFMNESEVRIPEIGETIIRAVHSKGHDYDMQKFPGTVIYVHPEFRFFTLRFGEGKYTYRESYIIGR